MISDQRRVQKLRQAEILRLSCQPLPTADHPATGLWSDSNSVNKHGHLPVHCGADNTGVSYVDLNH